MDDSGIDSDTTKRHTTKIEENDRVIICILYYFIFSYRSKFVCLLSNSLSLLFTIIIKVVFNII